MHIAQASRSAISEGAEERLSSEFAGRRIAALEEAYRVHGALLFSVARSVLENDADAEDCVHDALLRVWKSESYRRERGNLRAFLVVCVRNEALTRRRSEVRHLRIEQTLVSGEQSEELEVSDHVELEALRRSLADLPAEQREAIELAYYGGLSHAQIAQKLNLPLGTVKGRISLAMRKLRAALSG